MSCTGIVLAENEQAGNASTLYKSCTQSKGVINPEGEDRFVFSIKSVFMVLSVLLHILLG